MDLKNLKNKTKNKITVFKNSLRNCLILKNSNSDEKKKINER